MTVKEIYGTDFPIILAPMAGITDLPFVKNRERMLWSQK